MANMLLCFWTSEVFVTATSENVCCLAYETSSLVKMHYFTMFIAAVCLTFLVCDVPILVEKNKPKLSV